MPLKRGGETVAVPLPLNRQRQISFSVKWVLKLLKDNNQVVKVSQVTDMLIASLYNRGRSFEKKQETYLKSKKYKNFIRFFF
jgi:ribosomal protein S7